MVLDDANPGHALLGGVQVIEPAFQVLLVAANFPLEERQQCRRIVACRHLASAVAKDVVDRHEIEQSLSLRLVETPLV